MQRKDSWLGHVLSVVDVSVCQLLLLVSPVSTRTGYLFLCALPESVMQRYLVCRQKYTVRMGGCGNWLPSRRRFLILDRLDDLCRQVETAERRHDIGSLDDLA